MINDVLQIVDFIYISLGIYYYLYRPMKCSFPIVIASIHIGPMIKQPDKKFIVILRYETISNVFKHVLPSGIMG